MKQSKTNQTLLSIVLLWLLQLLQNTKSSSMDIHGHNSCSGTKKCMGIYLEKAPSSIDGEFYKLKLQDETEFVEVIIGLWVRGPPSTYQAFVNQDDDTASRFLSMSYRSRRSPDGNWNFNQEGFSLDRKLNKKTGFWSYVVLRLVFHNSNKNLQFFQILRSANKQEWAESQLEQYDTIADHENNVLNKCMGLSNYISDIEIPADSSGNYYLNLTASNECSYSQMTIVGHYYGHVVANNRGDFSQVVQMMMRGNKIQKMSIDSELQNNPETLLYLKQLGYDYNGIQNIRNNSANRFQGILIKDDNVLKNVTFDLGFKAPYFDHDGSWSRTVTYKMFPNEDYEIYWKNWTNIRINITSREDPSATVRFGGYFSCIKDSIQYKTKFTFFKEGTPNNELLSKTISYSNGENGKLTELIVKFTVYPKIFMETATPFGDGGRSLELQGRIEVFMLKYFDSANTVESITFDHNFLIKDFEFEIEEPDISQLYYSTSVDQIGSTLHRRVHLRSITLDYGGVTDQSMKNLEEREVSFYDNRGSTLNTRQRTTNQTYNDRIMDFLSGKLELCLSQEKIEIDGNNCGNCPINQIPIGNPLSCTCPEYQYMNVGDQRCYDNTCDASCKIYFFLNFQFFQKKILKLIFR